MENLVQYSEIASENLFLRHSNRSQKRIEVTGSGIKPLSPSGVKWQMHNEAMFQAVEEYSAYYLQQSEDETSRLYDLDWYLFLKDNHQKNLDILEMAPIMKGLHDLIRLGKIKYVNSILKSTLNSSSSTRSVLCLLRATVSYRGRLSEWTPLLNKSKAWMSSRNEDVNQELFGLI